MNDGITEKHIKVPGFYNKHIVDGTLEKSKNHVSG